MKTVTVSLEPTASASKEFVPYIGLKPFTEQEKDRFFGRDREISILLDKIRANRLTLLLAASGVGKSSLLQAGIMPALRADGRTELIYHRDWATEPGAALNEAISKHFSEKYNLASFKEHVGKLALKDMLLACTLFSSGQQIILLDQFEEFFNYQRFRAEFLPFIEELSAAILDRSTPASFVFSMREDFALELNAFKPFLPGVFDNYFRLEKLTRDQARLAIEQPLKQIGWSFAPKKDSKEGLLEEVLNDLAKREQEKQFGVQELPLLVEPPHLQIVCQELWQHHRDEATKQITHAAYKKAGGSKGILEDYFLRKIALFSGREQRIASAAFDHLVGQRATKIVRSLKELAELTWFHEKELRPILDKLQDAAILRRQKRENDFLYELYHDIFSESIDAWNREFKHRQRVKRLAIGSVAVLIAGGLLFVANDWLANYYGRYLQLSPKESLSDRIEVYLGKENSLDLFQLRNFGHETPFLRQELEADRRFGTSLISEKREIQADIVGRMPMVERIPFYMEAGLYEKGHDLAEYILKENKPENIKSLLDQLAAVRTAKSVDLLLSTAEKQGVEQKKEAVAALAKLGDKESLHKLLDNKNYTLQQVSAEALSQMGDRSVASVLINLFSDKNADASVRLSTAAALGKIGDYSIIPDQVNILDNQNNDISIRRNAAKILGNIGNNSAVPILVKIILNKDTDALLRRSIADALSKIGDYSVVPMLTNLLNNGQVRIVTLSIAEAFSKIGDNSATPVLINFLSDKNEFIKKSAAEALGNSGDPSVVNHLLNLLKDKNVDIKITVEAIGKIGNFSAVQDLINLLYVDKRADVRQVTAIALGRLGDKNAVPALINLLYDNDASVRLSAAVALGRLGDDALVNFLDDKNLSVRHVAAAALGLIGDRSALPALINLIVDTSKRRFAVTTLGRLKAAAAASILRQQLKDVEIRDAAGKALTSMNFSSPELEIWQKQQFKTAQEQLKRNTKQKAAAALGSVFSKESVALLSSLLADTNQDVVKAATESIGNIGEYHPGLVQAQADSLLKLAEHRNLDLRQTAITSLGQLIAFQGEKKAADFSELDQRVRNALSSLINDQQQKSSTRLTAIDALGDTGREEYAKFLFELLLTFDRSKEESLHSRCLFWLGQMHYAPARDYVENELHQLENDKAVWRAQRDQDSTNSDDADKKIHDDAWWQVREYRLGSALARIAPTERGIELLDHPLHYVRQGAVRALAGKADAALIGNIIQAHQDFDPADLPSPFPYTAFQAIDLALWNLEYTGTADDLTKLQDILANLKPCQIPGQEGAIQERLEWTIERLRSKTAGLKKQ